MSMGPLVSYRAGTWLIDECQIAFFMSCLMLRNLNPPILLLSSLSFVLPSTICLVSWIPRIPVLCSPAPPRDLIWKKFEIGKNLSFGNPPSEENP